MRAMSLPSSFAYSSRRFVAISAPPAVALGTTESEIASRRGITVTAGKRARARFALRQSSSKRCGIPLESENAASAPHAGCRNEAHVPDVGPHVDHRVVLANQAPYGFGHDQVVDAQRVEGSGEIVAIASL